MKCQKCGKEYDYTKEPEAGMGYIKCPGCGVVTDQTGKIYEEKDGKENMENRSVVSFEETSKADKNLAWDSDVARAELAKWASSDGSGEKEKIDWAKYRRGFAWYDGSSPDNFGSYKLPHHRVIDGQLVVVWHGVASAMSVVNGGMGGVDVPESEKSGIYNHLAKHYAQFDEQPPELKKGFFSDLVSRRNPYLDNTGK